MDDLEALALEVTAGEYRKDLAEIQRLAQFDAWPITHAEAVRRLREIARITTEAL